MKLRYFWVSGEVNKIQIEQIQNFKQQQPAAASRSSTFYLSTFEKKEI